MSSWKWPIIIGYVLTRSGASLLFTAAAPSFLPLYLEGSFWADLVNFAIYAGWMCYVALSRSNGGVGGFQGLKLCTNLRHHAIWTGIAVLLFAQYVSFSIAIVESDPASFGLGRTASVLVTLIACRLFVRPVTTKQWLAAISVVLSLWLIRDNFSFTSSVRVMVVLAVSILVSVACDFAIDSQKRCSCFMVHVAEATFFNVIFALVGYIVVTETWAKTLDKSNYDSLIFMSIYGWSFALTRMASNTLQYIALLGGRMDVETFRMCTIPANICTLIGQSLWLNIPLSTSAIPGIALLFLMLYWYVIETSQRDQQQQQQLAAPSTALSPAPPSTAQLSTSLVPMAPQDQV